MSPLRRRVAAAGLLALALAVALGALVPDAWVLGTRPELADLGPGPGAWLGTDRHGRDVAWRTLAAAASGGLPALGACAVATAIGVPAGALAGWAGGAVEGAARFALDALAAIPAYVLVLLCLAAWGDALPVLAAAAGLAWSPAVAEAVRGRVAALREAEYVLASRVHGVPGWRILWVHLVWRHGRRAVARQLLSLFAAFLVLEASLSYVGGLGIREPTPSWGNLLARQWGDPLDARFLGPALALIAALAAAHGAATALRDPDAG